MGVTAHTCCRLAIKRINVPRRKHLKKYVMDGLPRGRKMVPDVRQGCSQPSARNSHVGAGHGITCTKPTAMRAPACENTEAPYSFQASSSLVAFFWIGNLLLVSTPSEVIRHCWEPIKQLYSSYGTKLKTQRKEIDHVVADASCCPGEIYLSPRWEGRKEKANDSEAHSLSAGDSHFLSQKEPTCCIFHVLPPPTAWPPRPHLFIQGVTSVGDQAVAFKHTWHSEII